MSRKQKLFLVLIDFSKAYDLVPRDKLLKILKNLGCGFTMIVAIATVYWSTKSILGAALITATIGVRQGFPTSCILFVIYLNEFVKSIRSQCDDDGYLKWLHCLLLMDDTILLATTRDNCVNKFSIMIDYCDSHGMVINPLKSMFMVVNGTENDKLPITVNGCTINHCIKYTYLGVVFTEDCKFKYFIEQHISDKYCNVLKLYTFANKQRSMPFHLKTKVMDNCLLSSLLYGCESYHSEWMYYQSLY